VIHARAVVDADRRGVHAIERDALFGVARPSDSQTRAYDRDRQKSAGLDEANACFSQEHIDSWSFLDDAWSRQRQTPLI
jgi:hypothetical protein